MLQRGPLCLGEIFSLGQVQRAERGDYSRSSLYGRNAASPPPVWIGKPEACPLPPATCGPQSVGLPSPTSERRTRHRLQSPGLPRGATAPTIEENRDGGAVAAEGGERAQHEAESEEPPRSRRLP